MQTQKQQEKPTARPRPKRTVGELVAACLLVLWGAGTLWLFSYFLRGMRPLFLGYLVNAHSLFCLLGGLVSLAQQRRLAQLLISLAAVILLGISGHFIYFLQSNSSDLAATLPWIASFLLASLGFFWLGRFLGQQEDLEE